MGTQGIMNPRRKRRFSIYEPNFSMTLRLKMHTKTFLIEILLWMHLLSQFPFLLSFCIYLQSKAAEVKSVTCNTKG